MANAGRILIMPKGDYDSTMQYGMLDLVKHKGTAWLAKTEVKGIEPSDANSEYWMNMFDIEGIDTLLENNLKAETLTNKSFNITADTIENFFKGVAEYAVANGINTDETRHYKCIWANNDFFTIFCTKNPDNTITLFGYRKLGGTYIARYDITSDAVADFAQFANTKMLAQYLLKTGGTVTGALGAPNFLALLNSSDYGRLEAHVEGTATQQGVGLLRVGNPTPKGTAGNARGLLRMYGNGSGYTDFYAGNDTNNNVTILFPSKAGTLALKSDIPNIADTTIRYNSETDMVEVLSGGVWVECFSGGLLKEYLFSDGSNLAGFYRYNGGIGETNSKYPALSIDAGTNLVMVANMAGCNYAGVCAMSKSYDITSHKKLVVSYNITSASASPSLEKVTVFLTKTVQANMSADASAIILNGVASSMGTLELDVSNLSGNYYIGLYIKSNASTVTTTISEFYLD